MWPIGKEIVPISARGRALPIAGQSAKSSFAAPVAQLDRALPSEGKGHTFESCRVRQLSQQLSTLFAVFQFRPVRRMSAQPVRATFRHCLTHVVPLAGNRGHLDAIAAPIPAQARTRLLDQTSTLVGGN